MSKWDHREPCLEPGWEEGLKLVPEHLRLGLQLYAEQGVPTGEFLAAIIEGDLAEAARRADSDATWLGVRRVLEWLDWYASGECHGSKEKRLKWILDVGVAMYKRNVELATGYGEGTEDPV